MIRELASDDPKEPCHLCGGLGQQEMVDFMRTPRKIPYKVMRCRSCGLVFIAPTPSREFLDDYYNNLYDVLGEERSEYRACRLGYEQTTEGRMMAHKMDILAPFLTSNASLLEVGCGTGVFLDIAQKRGHKVLGIDLSHDAVEYAQRAFGVDARTGRLEEVELPSGEFDAVTMWDLIEHVDAPRSVLAEARRILRDGGILVLETPNVSSLLNRMAHLMQRLRWTLPVGRLYGLGHLYYFSPRTISRLLQETGFTVERIEPAETHVGRYGFNLPSRLALASVFALARVFKTPNKMIIIARA